ncbi:hypothetical protein GE061_007041 [Apolygus lucorum]|uniref:Peptidase S1 domain-containing protein n=1 Tax=Apolygus lucorum TaxID=248454 RepID=A0A8S9WSE7_APOLU|nr:hypothetical protein GE061_007041 [Apolygus lucorum]
MGRRSSRFWFVAGIMIWIVDSMFPCYSQFSGRGEDWNSGSRILNGDPADIADYPFYGLIANSRKIFLNQTAKTGINVHCGSALVSPWYFLTAFHCFMNNIDPHSWVVIMGLKDRCKEVGDAKLFRITKIIPYPKVVVAYKIKKHDIAMFRVDRPVENINPISLPTAPPNPGDLGIVIGFGLVRIGSAKGSTDDLACPLQKVTQLIPNQVLCKSPKEEIVGAFCVTDADKKNAAACRGDSGGPWITNRNGNLTVTGVSSFGDTLCKVSEHSDHYTNVFLYITWIQDVVRSWAKKKKATKLKSHH